MGKKNRFADAADTDQLIHQIIGAGSMCWENLRTAGVFDSTAARQVATDGIARLAELTASE